MEVTKKFAVCKSAVTPQAANFFVLLEFTIESSQISIPQPPNAPILQKSARFASSDPAPPSRNGGNCLIGLRYMRGGVAVAVGRLGQRVTAAIGSPSLSWSVSNSKGVASPSQPLPSYQKGRHWSGLFAACRRSLACVPRSQG